MSANQNSTTEQKHTPGPWYLAEDVSGTAFIFCNAGYRSRYIENDSERRANRLLAESAPELLEALQGLSTAYNQNRMPTLEERRACCAAIDKAKGASA